VTTLITQFNLALYDKMGASISNMIRAVYPISFACYYSVFEYYGIILNYFSTIIDVNKLVFNIFHNAGQIYDSTTDIIATIRFSDPGTRGYW